MAAQTTSFTYQFYLASKKGKLPNHVSSTENIVKQPAWGSGFTSCYLLTSCLEKVT